MSRYIESSHGAQVKFTRQARGNAPKGYGVREPNRPNVHYTIKKLKMFKELRYLAGPVFGLYIQVEINEEIRHKHEPSIRHLYLFGDQHNNGEYKCDAASTPTNTRSIPLWIKDCLQFHSNTIFDVFLEDDFIERPKRIGQYVQPGFIDSIRDEFATCFQLDKQACEYKNHSRFHYVDVRRRRKVVLFDQIYAFWYAYVKRGEISGKIPKSITENKVAMEVFETLVEKHKFSIPERESFMQHIDASLNTRTLYRLYREYRKSLRIKKQSKHVPTEIATKIEKFLDDAIRTKLQELSHIHKFKPFAEAVASVTLNIGSRWVDEYAALRMLRSFQDPRPEWRYCRNIIYFAGVSHIQYLRQILDVCNPWLSVKVMTLFGDIDVSGTSETFSTKEYATMANHCLVMHHAQKQACFVSTIKNFAELTSSAMTDVAPPSELVQDMSHAMVDMVPLAQDVK